MLVLSRKDNESISFTHTDGTRIELTVTRCVSGRTVIKIQAPDHIRILRKEVEERNKQPQ